MKTKRTNENLQKIQDMLEKKVQFSVRNVGPKLSLSTSTVWRLLRYDYWLKSKVLSAVHSATFDWSSHGSKEGSSVHGFLNNQLISSRMLFGRMKKSLFSTQDQIERTTVSSARNTLMTSFRPMIVTARRS